MTVDPRQAARARWCAYAMSAAGALALLFLLVFVVSGADWAGEAAAGLVGLAAGLMVLFAILQPTSRNRD